MRRSSWRGRWTLLTSPTMRSQSTIIRRRRYVTPVGHMMSDHMMFCHMINVCYSSDILNVTTTAPSGWYSHRVRNIIKTFQHLLSRDVSQCSNINSAFKIPGNYNLFNLFFFRISQYFILKRQTEDLWNLTGRWVTRVITTWVIVT